MLGTDDARIQVLLAFPTSVTVSSRQILLLARLRPSWSGSDSSSLFHTLIKQHTRSRPALSTSTFMRSFRCILLATALLSMTAAAGTPAGGFTGLDTPPRSKGRLLHDHALQTSIADSDTIHPQLRLEALSSMKVCCAHVETLLLHLQHFRLRTVHRRPGQLARLLRRTLSNQPTPNQTSTEGTRRQVAPRVLPPRPPPLVKIAGILKPMSRAM